MRLFLRGTGLGLPAVTGLVLVCTSLLSGCAGETQPEFTAAESTRVAQVGEAAAGELLRTLVGRLTQAVEEGGVVQAVEFCSVNAIPLTRMVEVGLSEGVRLKRTAFRVRNPENTPDEAEELALRLFEDAILEGGEPPSSLVQRVSETEFRYYKPLFMGEFCLQCHGDPEAMDPAVLDTLRATYPGDLATGYRAGDFRGVVRVSVPAGAIDVPEG